MTEQSSPLEAAAKAAYHTNRGVKPDPGWHDLSGPWRRAWRDIARAAIAAYEAEQTTPDLDELMQGVFWPAARTSMREGVAAVVAHLKGETR